MTYEQIVAVAKTHPSYKSNIEENDEFFAGYIESEQVVLKDNLILEMFCQVQELNSGESEFGAKEIAQSYEAAKVIFARHPLHDISFDFEGSHGVFGSPWAMNCDTPEEWAICQSRRLLETDEAQLDPKVGGVAENAIRVIGYLLQAGVSRDSIKQNIFYFCYGKIKFAKSLVF